MPFSIVPYDKTIYTIEYVGSLGDADIEALLREWDKLYARSEPMVFVHDGRLAQPLSCKHRYRVSDWLHEHDQTLRKLHLGSAVVVATLPQALSVKFIAMIQPLPGGLDFFSSKEEAFAWAQRRAALRQIGTSLMAAV